MKEDGFEGLTFGYLVGYRPKNRTLMIPHAWFARRGRAKVFAKELAESTDQGNIRVYLRRMADGKEIDWRKLSWDDGW